MVKVNQYVSAEIMFFGSDAANETCDYDIYGIRIVGHNPDRDDSPGGLVLFVPYLLGSGVFTLSTIAGVAAGYLGTGDLIADTLTWTPDATWATYIDGLVGNSPIVYSPADNQHPALLAFPDLLNFHGLVVDIKPDTAADGNALISKWT